MNLTKETVTIISMKTILKLSLFMLPTLVLTNCNKEETENGDSGIKVTISNTDDYEFDLMISGDEEGALIKTQAQNMEKSELVRDAGTNWSVVYQYKPLPNFVGSDYVEIETCTGGESTACSTIEIVRINFTITN